MLSGAHGYGRTKNKSKTLLTTKPLAVILLSMTNEIPAQYTKIINGERSIHAGWKRGKTARKCSVFPTVWAAIVGCKGERSNLWRYYTNGSFGQAAEYACPTCKAMKDHLESLTPADRQDALAYAQKAAGIEDYRTARARMINGIPTLL